MVNQPKRITFRHIKPKFYRDLWYNISVNKHMADAKTKNKWIAGAIKHPGALTAMAKAAGKSISEYCAQGNLSTVAKRRCNLRKTLGSFHK